ncbi:MAG: hypothetical protein LZF61_07850 [Nitrosomonas sp.]|nr:MAG: hypothetical protein LZF61_07850 [Nitrosomonas sp.]
MDSSVFPLEAVGGDAEGIDDGGECEEWISETPSTEIICRRMLVDGTTLLHLTCFYPHTLAINGIRLH